MQIDEVTRVHNTFNFGVVFAAWPQLLDGTWLTIKLSFTAMIIGLAIAIVGALIKTGGVAPLRFIVNVYIEAIRNTPFLVQLYFFYFGLPAMGIQLSPYWSALIAMFVNVGAYATEIIRAGIESINRGQIEAGLALNLSRLQVFRFIILKPALRAIYPALTSQFILLMLTSAVVSAVSANDLTSVSLKLQSDTFTSFEPIVVVTVIYFLVAQLFTLLFGMVRRTYFNYPEGR